MGIQGVDTRKGSRCCRDGLLEDHYGKKAGITRRALAPFADLCRLAQPFMSPESVMVLLKGQDFVYEEQEASKYWVYDLLIANSITDPGGRVVTVRNLKGMS